MVVNPAHAGGSPARSGVTPPSAYVIAGLVLALTGVGLLWVGIYSRLRPTLGGIPFFYWYSMLWVIVNAALQAIAYRLITRRRPSMSAAASASVSGGASR
ncbi:MAG TPA: DUF3311 domain-containing protein [Acidimicrobiales bacterium]|nr:DUF3311 domain-containing protein [Acidimicrobiales bacterium]